MHKKRFMNTISSIIMVMVFFLAMPQVRAEVEDWGVYKHFEYYIEDGNAVICSYNGEAASVEIPAFIDGNPVTRIGYKAFTNCDNMINIKIPNSITSIGEEAFRGCFGLNNITIPDSVIEIGEAAFFYCPALTYVKLPTNITKIPTNIFYGCSDLKNITIPNSVKSIGENAFRDCYNLNDITIPDSVIEIGLEAFDHQTTIYCNYGSYAQKYCGKYNILYIAANKPAFSKPTMSPYFDSKEINPNKIKITTANRTSDYGYTGFCWGYVPDLQTVINQNGNISVLNTNLGYRYTDNKFYIYEYSPQGKYIKELSFTPELPEIGAFTKDKEGNYYIIYGKQGNNARNEKNVVLVKYSSEGKKIKDFWLEAETLDVHSPFDSMCRIEISGNKIAAYFGRTMFDHGDGNYHQGSTGFILDINTFEWISYYESSKGYGVRNHMPSTSHSTNQFILPIEKDLFVFVDECDSYPNRSFIFNVADKALYSFRFDGAKGAWDIPAEMGGLAAVSDGYIFAGTYEKKRPNNDVRNLFILTINKEFSKISEPIWLTNFASNSGTNVIAPKIVQIDDNKCLIMYMIEKDKSTYCMIVDGKGNIISSQKKLAAGVLLNPHDVLRYNPVNGLVYWAVNDSGISLYSLDSKEFLPKVGDKLGNVLNSDVKTYINGQRIPCYNINDKAVVILADLRNYGFNVNYNNKTRISTITRAPDKKFTPIKNIENNKNKPGTVAFSYLYSDISAIVNGKKVESFNVQGNLAIFFESLGDYGTFKWDSATRSSKLTLK